MISTILIYIGAWFATGALAQLIFRLNNRQKIFDHYPSWFWCTALGLISMLILFFGPFIKEMK